MVDGNLVGAHSHPVQSVPQHVWEFAKEQDSLKKAADQMRDYLYELSTEGLIPVHTIEARAKSLTSYIDKTARTNKQGEAKYSDPLAEIDDCVAARVIVYTTRARRDFLELLTKRCQTRDYANPGDEKHNGYDSDHLVITEVDAGHLSARYPDLETYLHQRPGLEVQIRTVAGHAWAEYEHDVRYKAAAYRNLSELDRSRVDQWFIEVGGLRRYLDQVFNEIDEFLVPTGDKTEEIVSADEETGSVSLSEDDDHPLNVETLTDFLVGRYPDTEPGGKDAVAEILTHLCELNIATVAKLGMELDQISGDEVASLMDYPTVVSGARRLDDELLAALTRRYVDAAASDEARQQLLELRLRRVNGKFAIYVLETEGSMSPRPFTAARAIRELIRFAAGRIGPAGVCIDGEIALSREKLSDSANPRIVTVDDTSIYVATNLPRSFVETLMETLVSRLPENSVRVFRAGDQLFPTL